MVILEDKNAEKFKKMFGFIPEKAFPSILMMMEKKGDNLSIKFSDIDINQSLVVAIESIMEDVDLSDFPEEGETFRLPLSKNVQAVLKKFNRFVIGNNVLKGLSDNREVQLAMHLNSGDEWDFPVTAKGMLEFAKKMNDRDEILEVEFDLTKDIIKDIESCIDVLDITKETELVLVFTVGKNAKQIVVASKDSVGNNFKYKIDNINADDTFKVKYDKYLLAIFKALKNSDIDSFYCSMSNVMFGTSFEDNGIKVMLAVTIFEKIS